MSTTLRLLIGAIAAATFVGCNCGPATMEDPDSGSTEPLDASAQFDAGLVDAGQTDAGSPTEDAGSHDAGTVPDGGSSNDAGTIDDAGTINDAGTGSDAGPDDAGSTVDAGPAADAGTGADAGSTPDAGSVVDAGSATDAGAMIDAGTADAGSGYPGGCISGATGHYAARFHWAGNGSGSTAYVQYDVNNLPDHTRWRAGAFSRGSIGYTPAFVDTYLGAGGLELGSSNFIDVELSTAQLTTLRQVTLAIKGRSYNTTASGSYSWLTFDGAGAAPSGLVANSAPYVWYRADATSAFVAGNGSVLLRISPGPPSSSLVVNAVELCFDGE